MSQVKIDKVLVSILQRRLKSITEEMSIALARTTRSPILCEAKDFVTGLYDAKGKMLEQCENLPILAFSWRRCASTSGILRRRSARRRRDLPQRRVQPGQPEQRRGRFKPIFHGGELVAWAAQGASGRHRRRGPAAATTPTPPRSGRRAAHPAGQGL
jgi:N-methylhydantoinase B